MSTSTLATLYRRVPAIACQGHCTGYCGPLAVVNDEWVRMRAAAGGQPLTFEANGACSYLREGRCSVYDVRPLICRLWGVVAELPCEWGCTAERILTKPEASAIFATLQRIGGRVKISQPRDGVLRVETDDQ